MQTNSPASSSSSSQLHSPGVVEETSAWVYDNITDMLIDSMKVEAEPSGIAELLSASFPVLSTDSEVIDNSLCIPPLPDRFSEMLEAGRSDKNSLRDCFHNMVEEGAVFMESIRGSSPSSPQDSDDPDGLGYPTTPASSPENHHVCGKSGHGAEQLVSCFDIEDDASTLTHNLALGLPHEQSIPPKLDFRHTEDLMPTNLDICCSLNSPATSASFGIDPRHLMLWLPDWSQHSLAPATTAEAPAVCIKHAPRVTKKRESSPKLRKALATGVKQNAQRSRIDGSQFVHFQGTEEHPPRRYNAAASGANNKLGAVAGSSGSKTNAISGKKWQLRYVYENGPATLENESDCTSQQGNSSLPKESRLAATASPRAPPLARELKQTGKWQTPATAASAPEPRKRGRPATRRRKSEAAAARHATIKARRAETAVSQPA